jgi:hypothetical protein
MGGSVVGPALWSATIYKTNPPEKKTPAGETGGRFRSNKSGRIY